MPHAGEHPHNQHIENPAEFAHPVAAQGDIHIVTEPGAQAHMPAAPEFCDRLGQVGVIEVFDKVETEHLAQADGHIGIAGEVKINMQGEGDAVDPVE